MAAETPAATAVDAQAAATAADEANRAAAEANAQAQIAAANAEEQARARMAQIAEENQNRLNKFEGDVSSLRENQSGITSALTGLTEQNQALRTEVTDLRSSLGTMAETLRNLLTPPPPVENPEVKPPPSPSSGGGDGPQDRETNRQPQKRRIIKI